MWPWEHAIVGYLAYSLCCHLLYRDSPGGLEAAAVVFASVLPDLIDKPLAWEYGVFESGYAIGHSIFFAVPLAVVVGLLARSAGRGRAGVAFGLGYLLHPPSDVVDAVVREDVVLFELMFWPVATVGPGGQSQGFLAAFRRLFGGYWAELVAGDLSTYRQIQLGLAAVAFLVWLADGAPVLRECLVNGKRVVLDLLGRAIGPREEAPERR